MKKYLVPVAFLIFVGFMTYATTHQAQPTNHVVGFGHSLDADFVK